MSDGIVDQGVDRLPGRWGFRRRRASATAASAYIRSPTARPGRPTTDSSGRSCRPWGTSPAGAEAALPPFGAQPYSAAVVAAAPSPRVFRNSRRSIFFFSIFSGFFREGFMTFVTFDNHGAEGPGRAEVLARPATDTTLLVHRGDATRFRIVRISGHHPDSPPAGQCRAQLLHATPSVLTTQFSGIHTACPIWIEDFSQKLRQMDRIRGADLRTLRALRAAITAFVGTFRASSAASDRPTGAAPGSGRPSRRGGTPCSG